MHYAIHVFDSTAAALEYRATHGTGGWIFEFSSGDYSILFPPHFPPSFCLEHRMARGVAGRLIGCEAAA